MALVVFGAYDSYPYLTYNITLFIITSIELSAPNMLSRNLTLQNITLRVILVPTNNNHSLKVCFSHLSTELRCNRMFKNDGCASRAGNPDLSRGTVNLIAMIMMQNSAK